VSHLTLQAVHHRIEKDAYHYMVSADERAPLVLQEGVGGASRVCAQCEASG